MSLNLFINIGPNRLGSLRGPHLARKLSSRGSTVSRPQLRAMPPVDVSQWQPLRRGNSPDLHLHFTLPRLTGVARVPSRSGLLKVLPHVRSSWYVWTPVLARAHTSIMPRLSSTVFENRKFIGSGPSMGAGVWMTGVG